MTAREMLDKSASVLKEHLGEPFTVDGYPQIFSGNVGSLGFSNQLGMGGFLPGAEAALFVQRAQFDSVGLNPYPGMRLVVRSRAFVVTQVEPNPHRYRLQLEIVHPKTSDLPPV